MSDSPPTTTSPDILSDLVAAALKAGADAAEAVSAERAALSVGVRNGALEDVEREESRDLGLRVFIGRRQATVSASDLSETTRARLVERAVKPTFEDTPPSDESKKEKKSKKEKEPAAAE